MKLTPRNSGSLLLTIALACTPKDDASTDATATTGPADTSTGDGPGDGSTSAPPTTGAGTSTSGEATVGETGETGETTAGETTGDDVDPVCAAYCARLTACEVPGSEDCLASCASAEAFYAYPGEACYALFNEYRSCLTAASCDDLLNESDLCDAEYWATISDACTSALCDDYAAHAVECGLFPQDLAVPRALECTGAMAEALLDSGEACHAASETLQTCVNTLPCDQIDSGDICEAEQQAQDAACQ